MGMKIDMTESRSWPAIIIRRRYRFRRHGTAAEPGSIRPKATLAQTQALERPKHCLALDRRLRRPW